MIQLDFIETPTPNVSHNPLPNHGPSIHMITHQEPKPEINLDELPIPIEQVAWNLRQAGHLQYMNLRDRTRTRPAIYQLLKEGRVKKEDIMAMMAPKLQKNYTEKELRARWLAGDPTVGTVGDAGKYQYFVDLSITPAVYADAPPTGWGP